MCWHLCLASFSLCVCDGVPATSPPTSVPAPEPCTLRSKAWHRGGQSGKGSGAVFSQLHLTRALPVCSSHWCAHVLPCRTPVMPGAKPSRAPCRAQCATLVCWHEGSGDVLACLPGRVLCSGSPLQHLSPCTWRMRSLSSLSLGQGPLLPH